MNNRNLVNTIGRALFIGGVVLSLGAKRSPRRKPSQVETLPVAIQVIYGEKVSNFKLVSAADGFAMESMVTGEPPRRRTVPAKDWRYLMERINALRGPNNDPRLCYRATITLSRGADVKLGCLLAPNPLAKDLRSLVNLLAIYR